MGRFFFLKSHMITGHCLLGPQCFLIASITWIKSQWPGSVWEFASLSSASSSVPSSLSAEAKTGTQYLWAEWPSPTFRFSFWKHHICVPSGNFQPLKHTEQQWAHLLQIQDLRPLKDKRRMLMWLCQWWVRTISLMLRYSTLHGHQNPEKAK